MECALADGVTLEDVGGTAVLLAPGGAAAVLDSAGAEMLSALLDGGTPAAAAESLARDHDAPAARIAADAAEFAAGLAARGFLAGAAL